MSKTVPLPVHPRTSDPAKSDIVSRGDLVHPRTSVIHFGCRLNQYETDGIKASLEDNEHTLTNDLREADFVVINTCTVTNKADYKNRAAIRRAHRLNPQAKIIVTGCYATTDAEELRRMPGVFRVVSNDFKHRIAELLNGKEEGEEESTRDRFFFSANHHLKSRATLKIQDGCNKSCSYCKIPQARGRGVSRNADETLDAARELIDTGYGELVLTGINIGWYDSQGTPFATLIERLLDLPGNFHVRISSIEPGDVDEHFAGFFEHPKMARFLHIPVQSGSKYVLKMMRRGYTPENFLKRIERVRRVCPEIHVGTDAIIGFPAESEKEFQETLDFCRNAEFANIHIFPFSKRRNTPIVDLLERRSKKSNSSTTTNSEERTFAEINGAVIRERIGRLIELKDQMAAAYRKKIVDTKLECAAIAEKIEGGVIHYLTENYLRGEVLATEYPNLKRGSRFQVIPSS